MLSIEIIVYAHIAGSSSNTNTDTNVQPAMFYIYIFFFDTPCMNRALNHQHVSIFRSLFMPARRKRLGFIKVICAGRIILIQQLFFIIGYLLKQEIRFRCRRCSILKHGIF